MKIVEKLDQLFSKKFEQGLFSGNILVAEKGNPLYIGTFGCADYRENRNLTVDSIFELASVTKPMTAIGIILLEEQGKLHYDDPISKWIPQFPYPTVTLRQVLTHTSGLPDYMDLFEKHWDDNRIATNVDVLRLLSQYRPLPYFKPGDKYEYSNTGYVCLASVIEAVTGMSYSAFMQEYVFTPSGMRRTTVMNRRYKPEQVDDFAYGFIRAANSNEFFLPDDLVGYEYVKYLDGIQGDGMIHSTIIDLLSFTRVLKNGHLLSRSSVELAMTPIITKTGQKTPCGFGWFIDSTQITGTRVFHSGGWPGYSTILCQYPESDHTVIILSNVENQVVEAQQERAEDWLQSIEQCVFACEN